MQFLQKHATSYRTDKSYLGGQCLLKVPNLHDKDESLSFINPLNQDCKKVLF